MSNKIGVKKSNVFNDFVMTFLAGIIESIYFFHFVINGFHDFRSNFVSKKNGLLKFALFLSTCYLFSLILILHYSHTTLSVSDRDATDHILRAKLWLEASTLFVAFLFFNRIKN